ncbi:60 kDa lysophospholipase isoform X9 [Lutra lutra]|uniref:60 kDa lysophospholipase isoform X9 n=1 Tax=Lutra lutra TaxID=9657 RepID=UPI001FD0D5B8|nr:60 kDa lysophospholipase isoform X9 [Lutra lutra]
MARALEPQRRLLAVYTGGTIGMRSEQGVLVPGSGLAAVLRSLPMFHDEEYARACGLPEDTLVLPPAIPDQRVIYTVLECQPLFDSSDMTITEWVQIAQTIERHYGQYDGFVVIHGTDTMAFAASVLSFVLENLQKTVILTGAQVPIHALWNDSRENLLGALLMAGQYVIPEVCLFFQNQLFRGNRVTKVDSRRFAAFCSPHLPPLAVMGTDVTINWELVRKARGKAQLVVHSSMERDVGLLRLYPGIPAALAMAGAGIVSGFDMTSEAALAKLSYVLGHPGLTPDDRKELLARDLRGEMTLPTGAERRPSLSSSALGRGLTQLLTLSQGQTSQRPQGAALSTQEADAIREALVPSLACAAAHAGDLEVLQALGDLGSDLSLESFNGQTPLHAAARGGQPGAVTMLLRRGVDVDPRDEDGLSPLLLAVKGRHRGVIELLRAAGACLSLQELEDAGTELCRLAARADLEGLQSWWQAGADLSSPGYDGRSALLVAEAAGNLEVVTFLQNLKGGAGVQAPGPATL